MDLPEVLRQVEIALEAMLELRGNLPEMSDNTALMLGKAMGTLSVARDLVERDLAKRSR